MFEIMMYSYLISIESLWLRILSCIDDDVKDISFKIRKEIELPSKEMVSKMYPSIHSNSCLEVLVHIHQIQYIIEEYIKRESNLYTFFRLSNVVKLKEDQSIQKYSNLFYTNQIDDQEFDSSFKLADNNIATLMDAFYLKKCQMFEDAYKSFIEMLEVNK